MIVRKLIECAENELTEGNLIIKYFNFLDRDVEDVVDDSDFWLQARLIQEGKL